MSAFLPILDQYSPQWIEEQFQQVSISTIQQALQQARQGLSLSPVQLAGMLSPQAESLLEEMAQTSYAITRQRFGNIIQLFVPLYLSNECLCHCTYCGFSRPNQINRLTLSSNQFKIEANFLYKQGFRNILLLSGEDARYVNTETLVTTAQQIREQFSSISIEVQPLRTEQYQKLVQSGIDGVTVYQETYDRDVYRKVHLAGKKKNFTYRLETPERAGKAGMKRIGIGVLLGLSNWRYEAFYVALHAQFLEKSFWKSHLSISFPRMREAVGKTEEFFAISDSNFVQVLTALRCFLPNVGMILSTREAPEFRDHVFPLGITQMSTGSRTSPGGYLQENKSTVQFEIEDHRSPRQFVQMLMQKGYEPVWKDWDYTFQMSATQEVGR